MGNERSGRGGIDTEQFDRLVRMRDSGRPAHEAARAVGCDRKTAAKVYEGIHIFQQEGRLESCPTCGKRVHELPCMHCSITPLELTPRRINTSDLADSKQLFDREETAEELYPELVASVKDLGMIQPPVVVRKSDGGWLIVLGGRRVRAAVEAGSPSILCVEAKASRHRQYDALLTDEFLRADRSPIERGRMLAAALDDPDVAHTQKTLGERIGRSQSYVAQHVNLLKLPDYWRDLLSARVISIARARYLLPIADRKRLLAEIWRDVDTKDPPSVAEFRELVERHVARADAEAAEAEEAREEESPLDDLIRPRRSSSKTPTREVKLRYTREMADLVEAMLDQVAEARGYESREETVEALAREALGENGDPEPHILAISGASAGRRAA